MAQLILAVHAGPHDAAAAVFRDYGLVAAVSLERLTRFKTDGREHPDAAIDEVLAIAGAARRDVDVLVMSRALLPTQYFRRMRGLRWLFEQSHRTLRGRTRQYTIFEERRYHPEPPEALFDLAAMRSDGGFRPDIPVYFHNHHLAHALPCLFYSPGWDDALLVTADAGGDTVNYSHRSFRERALTTIYGGPECDPLPKPVDSIGAAYSAATMALGFKRNQHEGKLTGLAAMGKPVAADEIARFFRADEAGRIYSIFRGFGHMVRFMRGLAERVKREDLAASIQHVLEATMLQSARALLARFPSRRVGAAGGVFANVKLNRLLAEQLDLDEFFIFPPMGDDGMPVGGALDYLMRRDGMERWLGERRELGPLYLGRDYTSAIDTALAALPGVTRLDASPAEETARRLAEGEIGAIYTGRMEYGPRALGARSILANPARRETHDELNRRLSRTEFMPFAPVITQERAADVFGISGVNARACRYMTIACDVHPQWRDRIPAVVHVDGSARPQTIARGDNPLYYDIVVAFERATGLPALVNTSFNVHEEPIVNTPAECAKALTDGRIDFVVTEKALYVRSSI